MNRATRRHPFSINRINYQPTVHSAILDYRGIQADIENCFEYVREMDDSIFHGSEDFDLLASPMKIGDTTYFTRYED